MFRRASFVVINYGKAELAMNFLNFMQDSLDLRLIDKVIIVDNGYFEELSGFDEKLLFMARMQIFAGVLRKKAGKWSLFPMLG
ncbi:hypothetical protein M15_01420 [Atrimonas thermophila]